MHDQQHGEFTGVTAVTSKAVRIDTNRTAGHWVTCPGARTRALLLESDQTAKKLSRRPAQPSREGKSYIGLQSLSACSRQPKVLEMLESTSACSSTWSLCESQFSRPHTSLCTGLPFAWCFVCVQGALANQIRPESKRKLTAVLRAIYRHF